MFGHRLRLDDDEVEEIDFDMVGKKHGLLRENRA